jgi:alpha-tubulin suppressor-like RCC1 family protein
MVQESTRSSPVQVPGTQWNDVADVREAHSLSYEKQTGRLWAWGSGAAGRLGDGTTITIKFTSSGTR